MENQTKNTVKMTYEVIANRNPFAQKTVTVTVSRNNDAFKEFEEEVRRRFEKSDVTFNHAGKIVILN